MAHPKRRQSHTRTAKRRTHDKALGAWHVYHTICGECGHYRGRLVIDKEAKAQ